jgi:hypothetical protein
MYHQQIRLPFYCNLYPGQVKPGVVDLLVKAGLFTANMGIQSGSSKLRKKIFGRTENNEQILEAVKILNPRIKMRYELITDNSFETEDDTKETLDLFLQFPLPFSVVVFSLTYFPNYPITRMALNRGFIKRDSLDTEFGRDIFLDRRELNPRIQSLYHLITASAIEEFRREDLYKLSLDNELLENPVKMKNHLNQMLLIQSIWTF